MTKKNNIEIFKPNDINSLENLFIEDGISAGFPSPASDFEESIFNGSTILRIGESLLGKRS